MSKIALFLTLLSCVVFSILYFNASNQEIASIYRVWTLIIIVIIASKNL